MNALALLTTFLPALLQAGSIIVQRWPQAAPVVGALGGINPQNQTNVVSLLQEALNAMQSAGTINFGPALVVDGQFGGRTFAAIKVVQSHFGFDVQEPLASLEMQLLQSVLAKM